MWLNNFGDCFEASKIENTSDIIISQTKNELKSLQESISQKNIEFNQKDYEKIRELTLPVSLMLGQEANFENLHAFHNSMIEWQSALEDYLYESFDIQDGGFISRLLFSASLWIIHVPLWLNSSVVMHEFWHGNIINHEWWEARYGIRKDEVNEKNWLSLWDLFIESLKDPLDMWRFAYNEKWNSQETISSSWWINVNTQIASLNYQSYLKSWNQSMTQAIDYSFNKMYGSLYSMRTKHTESRKQQWDIHSYVEELQNRWIDIKESELFKYQALSAMLSWWTISTIHNTWKFLFNWEKDNQAIWYEIWDSKIFLPEFNTWLNQDNVSIEALSYIKNEDTLYSFGFEKPIIWKWENIYSVWINKTIDNDHYSGRISSTWEESILQVSYTKNINKNSSITFSWTKWINRKEFSTGAFDTRSHTSNQFSVNYNLKF